MKEFILRKKSKAFTLTEIILVLVILSISIVAFFSFADYSLKIGGMNTKEYYFQSDMRDTMNLINHEVQNSTALFLIPQDQFIKDDGTKVMDEEWSYIGVPKEGENKGQIVRFDYSDADSKWNETLLSSGDKNVEFSLVFDKLHDDGYAQKLLNIKLTGVPVKNAVADLSQEKFLQTDTEMLNAYSVSKRPVKVGGVDTDPERVSIAFRNDEKTTMSYGTLTFVIDVSGSMNVEFSGNKTRAEVLNEALNSMVDALKETLNLSVAIVDYAQYATYVNIKGSSDSYVNMKNNYDLIKQTINKVGPDRYVYHYLDSAKKVKHIRKASTNMGDGLRLAYQGLIEYRNNNSKATNSPNFFVLCLDGQPTKRSRLYRHGDYTGNIDYDDPYNNSDSYEDNEDDSTRYYYGKKVFNHYIGEALLPYNRGFVLYGSGSSDSQGKNQLYAEKVAEKFKDKIPNQKAYVIAVGASSPDRIDSCMGITRAMGNDENDFFEAGSEDDLNNAIQTITNDLVGAYWFINGPRIK